MKSQSSKCQRILQFVQSLINPLIGRYDSSVLLIAHYPDSKIFKHETLHLFLYSCRVSVLRPQDLY